MTLQPHFVQPPRVANWLVELFTHDDHAESIPGDLLEEFSAVASRAGTAAARRWYWRQSGKTIAHLIVGGFRDAPWTIVGAAVAGFLLRWSGAQLPAELVVAFLRKYPVYPNYDHKNIRDLWMFWVPNAIFIGDLLQSMLIGAVIAIAAKGKEMLATITLVLVLSAMTGAALWVMVVGGHIWIPWMMVLNLSSWFAIVAGGAIVRTRRLRAATRRSRA